jgi:hypothetical protein
VSFKVLNFEYCVEEWFFNAMAESIDHLVKGDLKLHMRGSTSKARGGWEAK